MYPQRLPEHVRSDAEKTLYRELERQLPDDVTVLHGVNWLERNPREADGDGEADFVIIHPDRGVLVLEVKGGLVGRDGATGEWYSRSRAGDVWPIKDPLGQARRNVHALRRKIAATPSTAPHASSYRIQRAVAFPDGVVGRLQLGPDAHPDLLIGYAEMADLHAAVHRALGEPDARWRLSSAAVRALVGLLAPTWTVEKPALGEHLERERQRYVELTEQQFAVLDLLGGHRRYAIAGCAGSGKTLLAVEQARRLARQGYRVLFTCFNNALADWLCEHLRESLKDTGNIPHVDNYHDIATEFCRRAGIALPAPDSLSDEAKSRYYNEELPDKFSEALEALPEAERFDAIIVDEAQDFRPGWWVTLLDALRDPKRGPLYIFYDNNQRIFVPDAEFPIPEPHFQLTANLRNTRAIHRLAMRYHSDAGELTAKGPEGREPELVRVAPGEERQALRKALTGLLQREGVRREQIVVLTPRSRRSSAFGEGTDVGNNLRLTWGDAGPGRLPIRNVHAFKGLEAPVVIFVEPERAHHDLRDHIRYVALSRAQHHLVVLGNLSTDG
jgi:hypothetical protein